MFNGLMSRRPLFVAGPGDRTAGVISPALSEGAAMDFPLLDFLDELACYDFHVEILHSEGLARECARDDDGDGVREVYDNTAEGAWSELRTYLRPFRGVSKWSLDQYLAIFQWSYNVKAVTADFLRAVCGL